MHYDAWEWVWDRFSSVTMYSNGDGDAASQCVHTLMCIGKWWHIRMLHPTLLSLWETVAWEGGGGGVAKYAGKCHIAYMK